MRKNESNESCVNYLKQSPFHTFELCSFYFEEKNQASLFHDSCHYFQHNNSFLAG